MGQKNGANYVVLYQMLCLMTINTNGRLSRQIGEVIIPAVRDFDQQTENHVREANAAHSTSQKPQSVPEYSQGSADDFSVIDDSEDLPF